MWVYNMGKDVRQYLQIIIIIYYYRAIKTV